LRISEECVEKGTQPARSAVSHGECPTPRDWEKCPAQTLPISSIVRYFSDYFSLRINQSSLLKLIAFLVEPETPETSSKSELNFLMIQPDQLLET
jgi:hypothetical protein